MIMYNGALVNVDKLMERIKTAERELLDAEQVLVDVRKENVELTATNSKSQTKIKDLTADLKSAKKRLNDAEASGGSLRRKNSEYLSVLNSIQEKITPVLGKKEKGDEKDKERSSS